MVRQTAKEPSILVAALEKAGQLTEHRWRWSPELAEQLLEEAGHAGNPARGETVFRRPELQCFQCHAIAGAGGKVGPDLASIGASSPPDYLLESLLDPNAKIKENYHAVTLVSEGRVFTGIPVRRTEQLLVLRDGKDQLVSIPIGSIEEEQPGRSLMQDGTVDSLLQQELVDLVRFLSELGKAGRYAAGTDRWLRTWQVLQPTPAALQRIGRTSFDTVAKEDPVFTWSNVYATVQGSVPLGELPWFRGAVPGVERTDSRTTFLRCGLGCNQPGKVEFWFTDVSGLTCWWDGHPVNLTENEIRTTITIGKHVLTLAIDRKTRSTPVQVSWHGSAHIGVPD